MRTLTSLGPKLAAFALQVRLHSYGFFGIEGLFGIILGLICFIIFVGILWKILEILLPKLITDPGWREIIRWLLILLLFVAFLHFFGLY
jgi:hypothetical protein